MNGYQLGNHCFDPVSGELSGATGNLRLEPQVARVLNLLASRPGEVLSRDEIFQCVWPDRVVVDESLTRCISVIRKALADRRPYQIVETLPKRGYRIPAARISVRSCCTAAQPDAAPH